VRRYYDAPGRLTPEAQQIKAGATRNVDYAYDAAGNRTKLAYPGASRAVYYAYDPTNRVSLVKDGSNVINEYLYVGPSRVSERKYMKASDGSTEVTTLHAMYDGVAAITRFYHDTSGGTVRVSFQYGRDKPGNPNGGPSSLCASGSHRGYRPSGVVKRSCFFGSRGSREGHLERFASLCTTGSAEGSLKAFGGIAF